MTGTKSQCNLVFPTSLVHYSLEEIAKDKISLMEKLLGRTREAPKLTEKYAHMLITSAGDADTHINII